MQDRELRDIYADACEAKGFEPMDGQYREWKRQLMWSEEHDVREAVKVWWSRETAFPMPAQLKPLIEQVKRTREIQASSRKELIAFRCNSCNGVISGYFAQEHGAAHKHRYCQRPAGQVKVGAKTGEICGGDLVVIHRESCGTGEAA